MGSFEKRFIMNFFKYTLNLLIHFTCSFSWAEEHPRYSNFLQVDLLYLAICLISRGVMVSWHLFQLNIFFFYLSTNYSDWSWILLVGWFWFTCFTNKRGEHNKSRAGFWFISCYIQCVAWLIWLECVLEFLVLPRARSINRSFCCIQSDC